MDIYSVSRSESADIASWLSPELDLAALSYSSVWCPTAPLAARDTGSCKYWCCLGQQDLFHHNCQRLGKRRNCWWKKSRFHHWCFSLTLKLVGRIGTNCRLDICLFSLKFKTIFSIQWQFIVDRRCWLLTVDRYDDCQAFKCQKRKKNIKAKIKHIIHW